MKIGLLGFTFTSANKGCEALTYSFISLLKGITQNKKIEVINYSYNTDLGGLPEYFPDIQFTAMNIKLKDIQMALLKSFKTCDVIFDITYGDNFSDIYSPSFVLRTTLTKKMVLFSGTPLILVPQTYGPFKNAALKTLAAHVIKKCKKVYSRDSVSSDYVNKIAGFYPKTVTDLAFLLPFDKTEAATSKKRIGLNISGLLWRGGFDQKNQFGLTVDYQEFVQKLLESMLESNLEVHIIPHVIDENYHTNDDDWYVCKQVASMYPEVILAPKFEDAIQAKNYIATMDVFIGGRMHSTIGAFSAGVVTFPFSYSRKFEGLYGSLNYDYIIHGTKDSTEQALDKVKEWIGKSEEVRVQISQINQDIKKISGIFAEDLRYELNEL